MARQRKQKPKSPAQIAADKRAKAFSAVNLPDDASALPAHTDIDARSATRSNAESARRMDAFEALKDGLREITGAYDAARRLEADIVTARGEHDRGRRPGRVDCDEGKDRTDAMVDASKRVDQALARIGERDAFLLTQLISPSVQVRLSATTWRGVVAYVTGEEHAHGQGAAVRGACANLASAYARIDAKPKAA